MNRPKIGVTVFIFNARGDILLGERLNAHGEGTWGVPGGHLELDETPMQCAIRETLEETGLEIENVSELGFTHDIFDAEKQYVTLHHKATLKAGAPRVMEPDKCTQWRWFALDDLPAALFLPSRQALAKFFGRTPA